MWSVVKAVAASALLAGACAGSVAVQRPGGPEAPAAQPVSRTPFDSSWEVGEPEYYTHDPRVR